MSLVKFQDIVFILLLINLSHIKTDLPVHCPANKIVGDWIFRINTERFTPSLTKESSCTHGMPDKIDDTIGDIDYKFSSFSEIKLSIGKDYLVYENDERIGKWTPVYDEGFILNYKNSDIEVYNSTILNCNKIGV